jgi:poly-gamma-glutamate capsule biosynthesis protein CapA/YwtB (metallophosphatase superfamily)
VDRAPSEPELRRAAPADAAPQVTVPADASVAAALPPDAAPFRPIVIAAVGDLMLGSTYPVSRLPANDGADFLDSVAPTLRAADIAFGNVEAPLVDGGTPHCNAGAIAEKNHGRPGGTSCWSFRMPARYAKHLAAAGFDVVSLANNHIDDFGPAGRAATIKGFDALGIAHTGPTATVARLTVRDATVDVIAFATDAGLNDMDDHDAVRALVAGSKADIVMVSFHGGAEGPQAMRVPAGPETYYTARRGAVRAFAHAAVDAGADLVVGHGPHVVRGLEIYQGRLIAYSLGSFATHLGISIAGVRGRTLILEAHLAADGAFIGGRVVPVRQQRPHGPRLDSSDWLVTTLRRLSSQDFAEGAPAIADDGTLSRQ